LQYFTVKRATLISFPQVESVCLLEFMNRGIYINDELLGYVCVCNEFRNFNESDREVLDMLADTISIYLQKNEGIRKKEDYVKKTFKQILCGDIPSMQIIAYMKQNITLSGNQFMIAVLSTDKNDSKNIPHEYLANYLNISVNNGYFFVFEGLLVGIIILDSSNQTLDKKMAEMLNILESKCLYCGCSYLFTDITSLSKYYEQALFAYKQRLLDPSSHIMYYGDCMLEHIIYLCNQRINLNTMVMPELQKLKQYDDRNNTHLTKTLKVYLTCNGHLNVSASKLGIHYNTLKYRLKIINNITGIYCENYNMHLIMEVSFFIMDKLNEMETNKS